MNSEFTYIPILKWHRKEKYILGRSSTSYNRKNFVQDRDTIWSEKTELKGTMYFVGEDFPYEVEQNRRLLLPVFLYPRTTRRNDEVFVFHAASSPFSNSYPCVFEGNGVVFNNVKQYVNYHKAVVAKGDVTATRNLGLKMLPNRGELGKPFQIFPNGAVYRKKRWNRETNSNFLKIADYLNHYWMVTTQSMRRSYAFLSKGIVIVIGSIKIQRSRSVKYIGLHIDEMLNWNLHISHLKDSLVKYHLHEASLHGRCASHRFCRINLPYMCT